LVLGTPPWQQEAIVSCGGGPATTTECPAVRRRWRWAQRCLCRGRAREQIPDADDIEHGDEIWRYSFFLGGRSW